MARSVAQTHPECAGLFLSLASRRGRLPGGLHALMISCSLVLVAVLVLVLVLVQVLILELVLAL